MKLRGSTPRTLVGDVQVPSSGPAIVPLGTPASGYAWDLRHLVVLEDNFVTATAGALVVPALTIDPDHPAANAAVDAVAGIPAAPSWSRGTIVAVSPYSIVVWIFGATPGHHLQVSAQIEETKVTT